MVRIGRQLEKRRGFASIPTKDLYTGGLYVPARNVPVPGSSSMGIASVLLVASLIGAAAPSDRAHCIYTAQTAPGAGMGPPVPPLSVCALDGRADVVVTAGTPSTGTSGPARGAGQPELPELLPYSISVQSRLDGCSTSGAVSVVSTVC